MHLIWAHFEERLAEDFMRRLLMMLPRNLIVIDFIKAYTVGTHLNCLNLLRQFKWVPTIYAFIKSRYKYTGCIMKTTKLLECAFRGVCAVIRSNMVCTAELQWLEHGPWKFVLHMGSSLSHWGLIIAPDQEANRDNVWGVFIIFCKTIECWVYSLQLLSNTSIRKILILVILNKLRCHTQIVDINSHTEWQTVQIKISGLLLKPTDLDLHCLQKQSISGFSRTRIKTIVISKDLYLKIYHKYIWKIYPIQNSSCFFFFYF